MKVIPHEYNKDHYIWPWKSRLWLGTGTVGGGVKPVDEIPNIPLLMCILVVCNKCRPPNKIIITTPNLSFFLQDLILRINV